MIILFQIQKMEGVQHASLPVSVVWPKRRTYEKIGGSPVSCF